MDLKPRIFRHRFKDKSICSLKVDYINNKPKLQAVWNIVPHWEIIEQEDKIWRNHIVNIVLDDCYD